MSPDDMTMTGLGPGAMLWSPEGEIPVEWLAPGDRLITRDHGAQPVLHVARLRAAGASLPPPIVFYPGEYGPGGRLEERLRVAPGLRGLVRREECESLFGTAEVLARFGDLTRRARPRRDPSMGGLSYHVIVMARHEIVNAGSLWVETADAGTVQRLDLPAAVHRARAAQADPPRLCLTREEAGALRRACPAELPLLDMLAA